MTSLCDIFILCYFDECNENIVSALSATISAIASEEVAAGEGALHTCSMWRPSSPAPLENTMSSTRFPLASIACARTPAGPLSGEGVANTATTPNGEHNPHTTVRGLSTSNLRKVPNSPLYVTQLQVRDEPLQSLHLSANGYAAVHLTRTVAPVLPNQLPQAPVCADRHTHTHTHTAS